MSRLRNTTLLAVVTVGFAILAVAFARAISEHDAVDAAISVALNKLVGLSPLTYINWSRTILGLKKGDKEQSDQ